MEKAVASNEVPCAVYVIKKDGVTIKKHAIGYRQLEPERKVASPHTWFDLASLTKIVFASVVLRLVENGEMSLSEPLFNVIPEWESSEKSEITAWHLLTHTSGYPGRIKLFESSQTRDELMKAALNLPLKAPVGSRVEYSSQGFMVLEEWLARSGLDWKKVLFEQILGPLNINGIKFGPLSDEWDVAATEDCPWRHRMIVGEVHDENAAVLGGTCAHAGLFGTIAGVSQFAQAVVDHYKGVESSIWTRSGVRTMCKSHTSHLELRRGLGWQIWDPFGSPGGDLMSSRSFGHTGFTGTSIWVDPVRNIVAVLLTNRVHPNRNNDSISLLRQVFHNMVISCLEKS
jgi:CubicO group peptidase (beta-lactamase class C family)